MKTANKVNHAVNYACVFLGVAVLVFGVSVFFTGQHNIDLSYNFVHLGMTDAASDGNYYTMTDIYQIGMNQINSGLWISVVGAFLGTTGLVCLSNMVGRKDL